MYIVFFGLRFSLYHSLMNKVAHNFRHAFLPCRAYGKSGGGHEHTSPPFNMATPLDAIFECRRVLCGLGAAVKPAVLLSEAGKAYSRRPATWLPTDRRDGPMTCVVRPTGSRNRGDVAKCRSPSAGGILHVPVLFTRYWRCEGGEAISLQSVSATSGGRRPHCGRPVIRFPACWCFHGNRP